MRRKDVGGGLRGFAARSFYVGGLLSLWLGGHLALGQTTATFSGTVHDPSGAVLPGVSITVEGTETGRSQESVSDDQGRYRIAGLPAGSYRVTASLPGFKKAVREGIQLAVAQEVSIDLSLQVGEIAEQVTVQGEAPLVDTTVSSVSGVINTKQMTELPLNGRDFTQLSLLETGTVNVRNTGQDPNKGFGTRVSVAGSRPDQTGYMLDGTDINGFLNFQAPGSVAGVILGVDAIREFRVEVSNFSAEYGRSAGGVFNMISKSGTNNVHGTLFEFLRNDNLDARNFFAIPDKAEFKRNQFGASFGGPIVRNRTFFFTNYEGLRQSKGLSFVGLVPDENARRGLLPAAGGGLRDVGVAASVRPIIEELYPHANGPNIGGGVATFYNSGTNNVREDYWTVKVDHEFSERNRFFGRFNFDDASVTNPFPLPNFVDLQTSRYQYSTLEDSLTINSNLLNVSRFAYNRYKVRGDSAALHPISVTFRPGVPLWIGTGGIGVGGLTSTQGRNPRGGVQNLFQYTDNVYYTRGNHSFKFGGNLERIHDNDDTSGLGSFSFSNLESFLRGIPSQLSLAMIPGSDAIRGWRQWLVGTFLQDDWRISSHLTMNLGVRWEFYTVPQEVNGKLSNLRDMLHDTSVTLGDPFWRNPSKKNVAPRVGLAWDPRGDGKTVVRAGYGIFFQLITPPYYRIGGARTPPFYNVMGLLNPPAQLFPDIPRIYADQVAKGGISSALSPFFVDFNLADSYEQKFNLTLSRQLFADTVLTVGYLGDRGIHLIAPTWQNQPTSVLVNGRWVIPPGTGRRNPAWGAFSNGKADSQSFYNGLQVKLDRRFSSGFQARASYTFSKNMDDGAAATFSGLGDYGDQGYAQNPDNPKAERALSKLDVRQIFTASWLYQLPTGQELSGVGKTLLGGWMLNGILSFSGGTPFTVNLNFDNAGFLNNPTLQRPDRVAGASNNPVRPGNPNQYFDPAAFVVAPPRTFGNLGRNTLIGPGYANLDLGLTKESSVPRISESFTIQFRVEVFNVLNRAQFSLPALIVFSNRTTILPNAGQITSTVADNRQIQLGLKFVW
ncbi:MAG: TonB-dependent receptor [Acidobacteria bacterium]|nr:TonB-dependent receptor [Acidobacteriota bacterium]